MEFDIGAGNYVRYGWLI